MSDVPGKEECPNGLYGRTTILTRWISIGKFNGTSVGTWKVSRSTPKTERLLTRKAIKNLKCNNHRSDKRRTESGTSKLAPSPALELAKIPLKRDSKQRPSSMTCPSMVMPLNPMIAHCLKLVPTQIRTLIKRYQQLGQLDQGKFGSLIYPCGKIEFLPQARCELELLHPPGSGQSQEKRPQPWRTLVSYLGKEPLELEKLLK